MVSIGIIRYLSCSIDDLGCVVLAIVLDNSTERILNSGIIAFDEVVLDKPDRERRFT